MKIVLKILSVLAVWAVVAYMVVYVDPETVKDLGVEGLYLPFILAVLLAVWYTIITIYRSFWVAIVVAALIGLGLILAIMQYMSLFTGVILVLIILFTLYLHKRNNSSIESRNSVELK